MICVCVQLFYVRYSMISDFVVIRQDYFEKYLKIPKG